MNVAGKLSYLRKLNNLTQIELAEKLNYSDKAVSKWENGESLPGLEVLYQITQLYGVTLDYLVTEEKEEVKPIKDLENEKSERRRLFSNRLAITLLAESAVGFCAISIYVYSLLLFQENNWLIFLWAIPLATIVAIIFNGIWGKRYLVFFLVSILLWSIITAFFFEFVQLKLWVLFLLGIPPQIAIILWSNLKSSSKT